MGDDWGGIEVTSMTLVRDAQEDAMPMGASENVDLTDAMRFIQPDDNNVDDRTVMALTLPEPLLPGETVTLDMNFDAKMRRGSFDAIAVCRSSYIRLKRAHA